MHAFAYLETAHSRRHGPEGYTSYQSYRLWLRDEFTFRCVYCLFREQWSRATAEFDLDHFQPQAHNPELGTKYENLLYACGSCNEVKAAHEVPDPTMVFTGDQVRVLPDGQLEGLSPDAATLIRKLGLNSDGTKRWRLMWMRTVELAEQYDQDQYRRLMGFPEDLPDLARLRPAGNTRPEGIEQSWFAIRQRSELPETY